jgi:hypothetical protein
MTRFAGFRKYLVEILIQERFDTEFASIKKGEVSRIRILRQSVKLCIFYRCRDC